MIRAMRKPANPTRTRGATDLISRSVQGFTIVPLAPGLLRLSLSISRQKGSPPLVISDEVYIPVFAQQFSDLPWNGFESR